MTITEERALEAADRADRELDDGEDRGPLHGIPYGAKDLLAAEGYPTTWGAEPYRDQAFEEDAAVVDLLDDAGAVLIAKLAMVELAGGLGYEQADASFTGPARNPWNTSAWTCGSSSGPGAAVPAGLVGFAIGKRDLRFDPLSGVLLGDFRVTPDLRPCEPGRRDGAFLDDGQARPDVSVGDRL